MTIRIGIIGGSGLYDMAELTDRQEVTVDTPFGAPSGPYVTGTLGGQGGRLSRAARRRTSAAALRAQLPREHLRVQDAGRRALLSASAVGSLKEEYAPLDLVIPDQFFDRTKGRISTFFGNGLVGHVAFAHPFCRSPERHRLRGGGCGRRHGAPRRHLRLHGRPAVLDARRVAALSPVGHGHHRHDQPAGSEARARSRDLLRDHRARHRLRLLASGPRFGDRRDDHRQPDAERAHGAAGHRRRRRRAGRSTARTCSCANALATAHDHARATRCRRRRRSKLAPIIGKYIQ